MVYDLLTVPIQRISRFRHGAEVALKSAGANRDAIARARNEILAYSCVATSGIVMLVATTFIS
jgi:hypothetical protein